MTNAVYFKGNWQTQFKDQDTRDEPFFLPDNTYRSVPTMTQIGSFGYVENADLQVLELAYEGEDLAMLICLPRDRDGLPKLESHLSSEGITRWISSLEQRKVKVFLPRFILHDEFILNHVLAATEVVPILWAVWWLEFRVGAGVAPGAPHRSGREDFPHPVLQFPAWDGETRGGRPPRAHDRCCPSQQDCSAIRDRVVDTVGELNVPPVFR